MRQTRPRKWVIYQIVGEKGSLYRWMRRYFCDPEKKVGEWRGFPRYGLKFNTKLEAETYVLTTLNRTYPELIGKLRVTWTM